MDSAATEECPHCFKPIPLGSSFCVTCGRQIIRVSAQPTILVGAEPGAGGVLIANPWQLMSAYDPGFDVNRIPPAQRAELQKTMLETFSVGGAIVLHFITLGVFTVIFMGLKHSKLPRVRADDFRAGKAIGFLFIPIFNLYWVFVFWLRLADRINFQFRLRNLPPPVSRGAVRRDLWANPISDLGCSDTGRLQRSGHWDGAE